jgi:hypothetical protein
MTKLLISFEKARTMFEEISHKTFKKSLKKYWITNNNDEVLEKCYAWLYCWAETGMGDKRTMIKLREMFPVLYGIKYEDYVKENDYSEARKIRYKNRKKNIYESEINNLCKKTEEILENESGYITNSELKTAIEKYAMLTAENYYKELNYEILDTSRGNPYDLLVFKDKEKICIEVKGTQTVGSKVILTKNEVVHAKKEKTLLFIVHSVINEKKNGKYIISGGKKKILKLEITKENTMPISYYYVVDKEKNKID